jgi:hypothetical protein
MGVIGRQRIGEPNLGRGSAASNSLRTALMPAADRTSSHASFIASEGSAELRDTSALDEASASEKSCIQVGVCDA